VFDDYYEHEVRNETDQQRVVLFFDVDRPLPMVARGLNRLLIAGIKRSAYVQDAKRNALEWDQRFERMLEGQREEQEAGSAGARNWRRGNPLFP
jgi:beta-hydroxylase